MSSGNYLFFIILSTVLITRIFLYFKPTPSPTFWGIRTHHYMYGILLAVIGYFTKNLTITGVGLGLFLDELTYLLIGGKTHKDNYSKTSLIGTFLFLVLAFFLCQY
ncbi:MAG: hypothetical protein AAB373_02820 [Patescibacteria group bacterium]